MLSAWLAVGMTAVLLGGITHESVLWWVLFAAPAALLVALVVGLPALTIYLWLLLVLRGPRMPAR